MESNRFGLTVMLPLTNVLRLYQNSVKALIRVF